MVGHTRPCRMPWKEIRGRWSALLSTILKAIKLIRKKSATISRSHADFDTLKFEDYDAVMLPGGRSPEYLRMNARVLEMVRYFDAQKETDRGDLSRPADSHRCRRAERQEMQLLPGLGSRRNPVRRHIRRRGDDRSRGRWQHRVGPCVARAFELSVKIPDGSWNKNRSLSAKTIEPNSSRGLLTAIDNFCSGPF